MDWFGPALIALCVILVALPPRWDPAIRLKARREAREERDRREREWNDESYRPCPARFVCRWPHCGCDDE